jgi:hypothetical protein
MKPIGFIVPAQGGPDNYLNLKWLRVGLAFQLR